MPAQSYFDVAMSYQFPPAILVSYMVINIGRDPILLLLSHVGPGYDHFNARRTVTSSREGVSTSTGKCLLTLAVLACRHSCHSGSILKRQ